MTAAYKLYPVRPGLAASDLGEHAAVITAAFIRAYIRAEMA